MGAGPDRGLDMSRYVHGLLPCSAAAVSAVVACCEWLTPVARNKHGERHVISAYYCTSE